MIEPKQSNRATAADGSRHLRPLPSQDGAAFSLLELLAAMAVLSLLSVVLFQMVDGATRLWRDKEQSVETYREARAALGFISREIGSALVLSHTTATVGGVPVYSSTNGLPAFVLTTATSAVGATATFEAADPAKALFFLAVLPPSARGGATNEGDVCAVGYYLAYTPDSDGAGFGAASRSRKLFRHFRSSADTLSAVREALKPISLPGAFVAAGLFRPATSADEPLARNIAEFRVRPMLEKSNGVLEPVDGQWNRQHWPRAVELSITALNTAAATRLSAESDWDRADAPAFKANSRTFTARVPLPSRPEQPIKPAP